MALQIVPYAFLLATVLVGWLFSTRLALVVFAAALATGLSLGRVAPIGLTMIAALSLSLWVPLRWLQKKSLQYLGYSIFLALAVAMFNHLAPGFSNWLVFDGVQFSNDSLPFTMYLNFDKTAAGILIYLFLIKPIQPPHFTLEHALTTLKALALLIALMLPFALATGYVRFDPKLNALPARSWLWMINNLFFVCLAEEALFRGVIQGGLQKAFPTSQVRPDLAVLVGALLFGLAHYKGGLTYIAFAGLAGLFYGYAYFKTGRLESPILVHFCLNLVHFLLFSYPALA